MKEPSTPKPNIPEPDTTESHATTSNIIHCGADRFILLSGIITCDAHTIHGYTRLQPIADGAVPSQKTSFSEETSPLPVPAHSRGRPFPSTVNASAEDIPMLMLEAMAQLAAMHTRVTSHFSRHAFLLGVRQCTIPPIPCFTKTAAMQSGVPSSTCPAASPIIPHNSHAQRDEHPEYQKDTQTESIRIDLRAALQLATETAHSYNVAATWGETRCADHNNENSGRTQTANKQDTEQTGNTVLSPRSVVATPTPEPFAEAHLTISHVPYSEKFPEHPLRAHYEELYQWLIRR